MDEHQGDPYSPPVGSDQSKMPSGLMVALHGVVSVVSGFVAFSATCAGLSSTAKQSPRGMAVVVQLACLVLPIPIGVFVARSVKRRIGTGRWRKEETDGVE